VTLFGPIKAPQNVEDAVVAHLRRWLAHVIRELETQNDMPAGSLLRPPAGSIYGGVDFESWQSDTLPAWIVTVAPDGEPDHHSSTGYSQAYSVAVATVIFMATEDESRAMAAYHGAAAMAALVQHPSLNGFAVATDMLQAPKVTLPDAADRLVHRCESAYRVLVDAIVNPLLGPSADTPEDAPEYDPGDPANPWTTWPTAQTVTDTVTPVQEIDP
jgi:hypothetical protein